jgi:hypothetical protein
MIEQSDQTLVPPNQGMDACAHVCRCLTKVGGWMSRRDAVCTCFRAMFHLLNVVVGHVDGNEDHSTPNRHGEEHLQAVRSDESRQR